VNYEFTFWELQGTFPIFPIDFKILKISNFFAKKLELTFFFPYFLGFFASHIARIRPSKKAGGNTYVPLV